MRRALGCGPRWHARRFDLFTDIRIVRDNDLIDADGGRSIWPGHVAAVNLFGGTFITGGFRPLNPSPGLNGFLCDSHDLGPNRSGRR
jgi:hypothetical protein